LTALHRLILSPLIQNSGVAEAGGMVYDNESRYIELLDAEGVVIGQLSQEVKEPLNSQGGSLRGKGWGEWNANDAYNFWD